MIAIVNYGLGNLHSVQKAIEFVGGTAMITEDPDELIQAEKIIIPGVGAFKDGMDGLRSRGLSSVLIEAANEGKQILGICLGMQLLFQESEELGSHKGLGLIAGKVVLFKNSGIKVPQIGWNQIETCKKSPLLEGIGKNSYVYFNHSYFCQPDSSEDVLAVTDYGGIFSSAVESQNLFGVQFHPEKSQKTGLRLLKNFVEN